jgi:hypothetical protein
LEKEGGSGGWEGGNGGEMLARTERQRERENENKIDWEEVREGDSGE